MTKQELIKYFELLPYVSITQMGKKRFIDLIEQLDEQEIVTIPKIVADWIEKCKAKEKSLLNALLYTPEGVNSWVDDPDNQETFALAWIFGYKVEEEKEYLVKIKANNQYIINNPDENAIFFYSSKAYASLTRKELEEAGFGWVFDCPGIEIEEVEKELNNDQ
nr:MAG TPA: Protein of unknown function (DUF1642) [Caudoviricetes sp.]